MADTSKFDFIIIGSGLGALVSATILAKEGLQVLVLEKGKKIGGLLHTFKREQTVFNTGMNYIGALGEGGFLHQYFKYLGIADDLDLKRMDMDSFEEISFGKENKHYSYAQGKENFIEKLLQSFPQNATDILKYTDKIWQITSKFPLLYLNDYEQIRKGDDYLNGGAFDYIDHISENQRLKDVLGATNSLYGGHKEKTPLYVHALVNRQFIESAHRFVGGSQQLADALQNKILEVGGQVLNRSNVTKISTQNPNETWVELEDGQRFYGHHIISNIHPAQTLAILDDTRLKKVYRQRIEGLQNTVGFFNLYLIFKPNSFPYLNRNYYHFMESDVWSMNQSSHLWPGYFMFYTGCASQDQKWADNASVMTYLNYDEVKQWKGTSKGLRGPDYEEFKQKKVSLLLRSLEQKFPGIGEKIQSFYSATPLTYEHYISAPQGAAYGIEKDYHNPYKTLILPKTKIPNLYFTGQNLNMHGALGVTIGAVLTSAEILGYQYLLDKIKKEIA